MEISYDREADAMYIEFRKGTFAKNRKADDFTIVDLDKDNNLLGIELLEVSKRIPAESLKHVRIFSMENSEHAQESSRIFDMSTLKI